MTSLGFLLVLCVAAADAQVNLVSQAIGLLQDLHTKVSADAEEVVFSVVRRESGGRRPANRKLSSPTLLPQSRHRERCRSRWNALELTSVRCDQIASPDAELAAATAVREDEVKEYSKSEAQSADEVGTLERAISIIQREMSKNPAFLQKKI